MKQLQFEIEYERRAEEALEHHLKVLELAYKLPTDEFKQFYWEEYEAYRRVMKGLLLELNQQMKGIEQHDDHRETN